MRFKYNLWGIAAIFLFSFKLLDESNNHKTAESRDWEFLNAFADSTKPDEKCTWGFPFSRSDSTGRFSHGIYRPNRCFPGFRETYGDSFEIDLTIFDRYGSIVFETHKTDENWVCKDSCNFIKNDGDYYYYYLVSRRIGDSLDVSTNKGAISIIKYEK